MEIWPVEGPWPGRLAVCSRPRSAWFLVDDLHSLRAAGYGLLVSALTPEEVIAGELQRVPGVCQELGIEFHHFPVGNLQVPAADLAAPKIEEWHSRLGLGDGIAVHCWATVGRGPTLAAALLMRGGVSPDEAWLRIASARGREVPDTLEQRRWAQGFALLQEGT